MKRLVMILLVLTLALMPVDAMCGSRSSRRKATTAAQQRTSRRALLVGISNYRSMGPWGNIHGAEDVQMLQPVLKQQGFKVTSLVNEQATYRNIKKQLRALVSKARAGDIVYIHFSTHGQPVEDGLNGLKIDEADGWDESIVPIDAGNRYVKGHYVGDKHLTDDEMEGYFDRLRRKLGPTGVLYVAMDACHSGELSRGIEMNTVRGTSEGLSRSGKTFNISSGDRRSHYILPQDSKLAPALFLEACTAQQRNSEIRINGKECGSLSYNIKCALEKHALSKNRAQFKTDVQQSTQQPGRWPSRQTLVVEE